MPDPTKAEFDAAAQQVMQSAPPGLSRDEFFARIDKQLATTASTTAPKPTAQIGPAMPGTALPDWANEASNPEKVTIADLQENPRAALIKMGQSIKREATDPKTWLSIAAMYFGPKVFNVAGPIVARAANSVGSSIAEAPIPSIRNADPDLVSIASPRAGAILRKIQGVANAIPTRETPPSVPGYDRYMPNGSALTAEQVAAQAGSGHAIAPGQTPAPSVAGPQGVPTSAIGPEASTRAATMAAASAPPETVAAPSSTPSPTGPPVPAAPVESPVPAAKFPIQKALNELAIQARRQGTTLTAEESQAAATLMQTHGVSAAEAVKTSVLLKSVPTNLNLSGEEATQYLALRSAGKSGAQAEATILKLRQLAQGLPTTADVNASVPGQHARGVTGKWKADQ